MTVSGDDVNLKDDSWATTGCLAVCAAAPFAFLWPLSVSPYLLGGFDVRSEGYPYFFLLGQGLRSGLHLWNELSLMGVRLLGSPVSLMTYPPIYLFAPFLSARAFNAFLLLHYSIAATGMWLFLREIRLDRTAAVLGALVFAFSGFMAGHREHTKIIMCAAWLPYCLLFWERLRRTGGLHYMACLSVCLGLTILTGHFQIVMLTWIALGAYVVAGSGVPKVRDLGRFVMVVGIALLIGMAQLLPTWDLLPTTARATRLGDVTFRLMGSFNPLAMTLLVAPQLFGPNVPRGPYGGEYWGPHPNLTEMACYVGIIPLALAGGTLCRIRSDRSIRFWWVLAVLAGVLALGRHTPVGRLLAHAPIYGSFRVPARHFLEISCALAVLSAYGMHRVRRGVTKGERRLQFVVLSLCLVMLIGVLAMGAGVRMAWGTLEGTGSLSDSLRTRLSHVKTYFHLRNACIWIPLVVVVASCALLPATVSAKRRWRTPAACVVTVFVFLDLMTFGRYHDAPERRWRPLEGDCPPEVAWLREHGGQSVRRVVPVYPTWMFGGFAELRANLNIVYGIPSAAHLSPVLPWRFEEFYGLYPTGQIAYGARAVRLRRQLSALGVSHQVWYGWPYVNDERVNEGLGGRGAISKSSASAELLQSRREEDTYKVVLPGFALPDEPSGAFIQFDARLGLGCKNESAVIDVTLGVGESMTVSRECRVGAPFRCYRLALPEGWQSGGDGRLSAKCESSSPFWIKMVTVGRAAKPGVQPVEATDYELEEVVGPKCRILRNPGCVPRAYFAADVEVCSSVGGLQARLCDRGFDPWRTALVEDGIGSNPIRSGFEVEVTHSEPERLELRTWNPEEGFLIVNESWDRDWRATIDGEPTQIHRVNGVARGMIVPGGEHRIAMAFWPVRALASACISAAGLLSVLVLFAWAVLRGRRVISGNRPLAEAGGGE